MEMRNTRSNVYMIYQLIVMGLLLFLLISNSISAIAIAMITIYILVQWCKAFEKKYNINYITFSEKVWKDKDKKTVGEILDEVDK